MERQVLPVPGVYLPRPRKLTVSDPPCAVDLRVEVVVLRLEWN